MLFIAGYEENASGDKQACYWTYITDTGSTTKTNLGNSTDPSEATSVSSRDGGLYIGGWEGSNDYYWTYTVGSGGTPVKHAITDYDNDYNGKVHGIYANPDEDIYLVGEHYSQPTSWNPNNSGQAYLQGGSGRANDLFFNDTSYDYFVVGTITSTNPDEAVLWINPDGTLPDGISLTSGTYDATATSIFEYETELYIGGWENTSSGSNGYYWIYTNEGAGTLTKHAITGYNTYTKVYSLCINFDNEELYLVGKDYGQPTSWNSNNSGQAYLAIESGGSGAAYDLFCAEDSSEDFYVDGYAHSSKDFASL